MDPQNAVPETNESNNTGYSATLAVYDVRWSNLLFPDFSIQYFRVDWDDTSLTTFDNYYDFSNSFIEGFPGLAPAFHDKSVYHLCW